MAYKVNTLSKENQEKVRKAVHKRLMNSEQSGKSNTRIKADKVKKKMSKKPEGTSELVAMNWLPWKKKGKKKKLATPPKKKKNITVNNAAKLIRKRKKMIEEASK